MTPNVLKKLEEAFALGCTDLEASLYANISPATLYNHQDRNPGFLERKEQLKMHPILKARTTLVGALEEDASIALKYLERKKKDEFSPRRENDITTNGDNLPAPIFGGLSVREVRDLPDQKLDEIIERIQTSLRSPEPTSS